MNVRFLETFLWVAKLRSFSAAALRLHATQAAISNRIATLERDLGTRLFDRDLRDVRLTPSGRMLLERAADIVRLTSEFRDSIGVARLLPQSLAIGTADMIVCAWLPSFMQRMRLDYPGISVTLSVATSLDLARQLALGEIDLAFVMGPVHELGVVNVDLGALACCWVASPETRPTGPMTVRALIEAPVITFCKGSPPHHALMQVLRGHGIERSAVRLIHCNSAATITRLVRDGLGAACLPEVVVREFIERGEMRRLPIADVVPPFGFHAVYPDGDGNQAAALVAGLATTVAGAFSEGCGRQLDDLARPPVGARGTPVARSEATASA